jgi:putative transposase
VERLMHQEGLRGVIRGRKTRTTLADESQEKPLDRVHRRFVASRPDELWVADFTFVATWAGFVYVAFIIDVFARRIVGWRVSRSMRAELVSGDVGGRTPNQTASFQEVVVPVRTNS